MVSGDTIVHNGLVTVAKLKNVTALAKSQNTKSAVIKGAHYQHQGAAVALAATVTGKGRAATVTVYANKELAAIVNSHGDINYYNAITTIASVLNESLTFEESIRADGQRVVKRSEWLNLKNELDSVLADTTTAKAKARRYNDALAVYTTIQAHADGLREAKQIQG
jgi:hypothetical protein